MVDIWTSRHVIGQVSQATGYVRRAYYLGLSVQSLCAQLNQVKIGTHQLQCEVTFAGRASLWQPSVPEQWDATIGGNQLPQLAGEALQEYQALSTTSYADNLKSHVDSNTTGVILYDSETCADEMK